MSFGAMSYDLGARYVIEIAVVSAKSHLPTGYREVLMSVEVNTTGG